MGQPVPVLQGPAANVPNLQLTLVVAADMVYTSCIAISMHARAHINDWWVAQIHTYHALQHYFLYHSVERESRLYKYLESMFFGGYIYII